MEGWRGEDENVCKEAAVARCNAVVSGPRPLRFLAAALVPAVREAVTVVSDSGLAVARTSYQTVINK